MPANKLQSIHCDNEFDKLKHVIVAPPKYMKITEVINETQNYYANENINIETAILQHENFVKSLEEAGATVYELPVHPTLNEQVFTRDIGFVIGGRLFISHMARDIRKKEITVLENWLKDENIPYIRYETPSIEGGDVIIDGKLIWVGISGRTSLEAAEALQEALPDYEVIPVKLREDILHLDCVFNVVRKGTALIYPDVIDTAALDKMKEYYTFIEVTAEEQFAMGPNVLAIGDDKLISLPENKRLNDELKHSGFKIIEVPFSEIIKSGGSYRCCTLPFVRK